MRRVLCVVTLFLSALSFALPLAAQKEEVQERLAKLKENQAQNKKDLATYTWQETDTISLKGETKKVEHFQVVMGADGKPAKTPLDPQAAPAGESAAGGRHGGGGGRFKEKIVEKKKEEFADYAHQIAALAHQYAQMDPEKLEQAKNSGNIKLGPGKMPDEVALIITNYIKPNDSMTITINKNEKAVQNVQIASYLDNPGDAVRVAVNFAKLTDGTNHVSNMVIDGESKQLNVNVQNANYQKKM